jgi:large subunit ribosomal protein L22
LEQLKEQDPNLRNKMAEEEKQKLKVEEKREEKIVETPKEKLEEKKIENKIKEKSKAKEESKPKTEIKEEKDDKKETKEKSDDKEKKSEKKKDTKPKVKKTEAFVNMSSLPISTKHSIAICKFINGKKIEDAIKDLEQVVVLKKAVPMKGEIPHRKGMMSGRYPKNASLQFIKMLKSLSGNANANGLENPRISEAIANLARRPYGNFGRVKRKRTHVKIIVKEIQNKEIVKEVKK